MAVQSITRLGVVAFAVLSVIAPRGEVHGQGLYVTGVGSINRSMGGAGTGAPIDAIGALNWNPASIGALPTNELAFGIELLAADIKLNSNVGPGTTGDSGFAPIPSIGWVHHMDGTPFTIGLGLYGTGGFKNNQPSGNAILPGGSPAFASANFLQVAPTISCELSDTISVGLSPTVTIGELGFDPLGPPVIAGLGSGQGNRSHWGGGFQAGVYYTGDNYFNLGFTYKSPQWMETFQFFTSPSAIVPNGVAKYDLDLPMILSLGAGYEGIVDWTFAADVRYFAYEDADGFKELGWRNVWAVAFGAQRRLSDALSIRFGANFNEAPIVGRAAAINVVSPLIQSYNVSAGATYRLTRCVDINVAYVYMGDTDLTGPLGGGGATVTHKLEAHSAIMGITVRY